MLFLINKKNIIHFDGVQTIFIIFVSQQIELNITCLSEFVPATIFGISASNNQELLEQVTSDF